MSNNPLLTVRGLQWLRVNGGPSIPVRRTLHVFGASVADDEARNRTVCHRHGPGVSVIANVEIEGSEEVIFAPDTPGWFGITEDFGNASEVYVTATGTTRIAGFAPPTGSQPTTKTIINMGAGPFDVFNVSDVDLPGFCMGAFRTLNGGESCRLVWDPIGLRWLVNDGLYSNEYLTHGSTVLTHDGEVLTEEI